MAYIPSFTSSTGKPYATSPGEARGNWERQYLDPSTSAAQAQKLYGMYGTRYNWMPLGERTAPTYGQPAQPVAPTTAPVAATPAVSALPTPKPAAPITPANQAEVYPHLTAGKIPQAPQIPKFEFNASNPPVKSLNSYIPKIENSPTFKYQLSEGQRVLDQKLAAEGLTGSGAALELSRRNYNDLLGKETDRAWETGKLDQQNQSNLYNTAVSKYANDINLLNTQSGQVADAWRLREQEAQRVADAQTAESMRVERESNTYWQRLMELVGTLQAANPLGAAQSASKSLSDLYAGMAPQMVSYLSQMR